MITFDPPTIIVGSKTTRNTFTTLTQPFPVTNKVGIWSIEPLRNEQGLLLDVPIFLIDEDGVESEVSLQDYPINRSNDPFEKKNVVCRWVTPSYQTVGGDNNDDHPNHIDVGVIAFHGSGHIDRVEFFLNGGSNRVVVKNMSHHPEHDVTAYWIRIDNTSNLQDSGDVWATALSTNGTPSNTAHTPLHELQAVVYPKFGKPRILAGKHNNVDTRSTNTGIVYNAIPDYWEDPETQTRVLSSNSSGIISFYFSSNFNNTLFQGSVFVSTDGVDDLNRSGASDQPMRSIEFAYRKLIRMKHKFYNNLTSENTNALPQGEVGGGTIYLMEHTTPANLVNGHKLGYKNNTLTNVEFTTLSRMRWVTIRLAPGARIERTKIKGWYLQPFPATLPTTESAAKATAIKKSHAGHIISTLTRLKGCIIESEWPYSEYLFGIGPDLDAVGDIGNGQKLIYFATADQLRTNPDSGNWKVKGGTLYRNIPSASLTDENMQEHSVWKVRDASTVGTYKYASPVAESTAYFYVCPRVWFDSVTIDGGVRDSKKIYEWADALGMTHSTSFVGAPDIVGEQVEAGFPPDKRGVFSNIDGSQKFSLEIPVDDPRSEGLTLTTPRVFVQATDRTLQLTDGLGFTTGIGYTFDFCFVQPEFSGTKASANHNFIQPCFLTNTLLTNIEEPASLAIEMFINSNCSRYEADIFRNPNFLVYQPFVYDGFVSRNYVNVSGSPLFAIHSDVFQTIQGHNSITKGEIGVVNSIFYRFNSPSPRSKRYADINARLGYPGVGDLSNINFTSQWNISGRMDGNPLPMFYDPAKYVDGDGKTYQIWFGRHMKDLVFHDCLIYTADSSQQLIFTCLHENLLIRNTKFHGPKDFNSSSDSNVNWNPNHIAAFGGPVTRYKDAVPDNPFLNVKDNNVNDAGPTVTALDHMLLDNVQQYKTSTTNSILGTYEESLKFNLRRPIFNTAGVLTGFTFASQVIVRGATRPKPIRHTLYKNPINLPSQSPIISDLRYPFKRDAQGKAGANQPASIETGIAAGNPGIMFPVPSDRYQNAVKEFIARGNPSPQPNSSTRGEWFTYHKTIPSSTTFSSAPYGWVYSRVPEESFRYARLPSTGPGSGTIIATSGGNLNAILFNAEPGPNSGVPSKFLKYDTNTFGTILDSKSALGTGWDPTFGTGKENPQPTDPGFNPNQRGLRETVILSYTNFDFDYTRSDFGEILLPADLPALPNAQPQNPTPTDQNQVPISNHPITISLTTTDIDSSISWNNKNADAQHGLDGFYDSGDQIPNYLNEISVITNPEGIVHIGDSRSNERAGDDTNIAVNQGGIRIDKTDIILPNISVGGTNSLTITNLVQKFGGEARNQGGNTFAIILHGKTEPSPGCTFAEFKYVTPEIYETSEDWEAAGSPTDADRPGFHFPDFHKKSAYISFHSKEASKTGLITSDSAFSFRKSVHHKYKKFIPRTQFLGISCSNALNGISEIHMVTSNAGNNNWLSSIITGSTCNINLRSIYPNDPITSANKVDGSNTSPNTISCLSKTIEFVSFSNNIIKLKNKSATSLFSGINPTDPRLTIQHNGAVACSDPAFNFNSSVSDYSIPAPIEAPEQEFTLRVQNEIGNGSSNLLAYKVPLNAIRLFSSPNTPTNILNLGITTGSYIRVSGSASNNGIYQVLSVIDGIQDDTLSNTKTNNATEFQYLELSRNIIPENSSTANSISVENVSHYPILHVKYQTPV